ncbi:MAG: Competence protein ComEA helix-hairpin-helix region [Proteobacteria bacterium]|nr:Competence protein ComEA helix-hairpin-helix region [Pseudomonadota bacterium]
MKYIVALLLALLACINLALAAVNINTATQDELVTVKGIGPSKAKAIIDYRTKNGPFKSVDDLKEVKGFGEKTLAKLKADLTVAGGSEAPAPAVVKAKK